MNNGESGATILGYKNTIFLHLLLLNGILWWTINHLFRNNESDALSIQMKKKMYGKARAAFFFLDVEMERH